MLQIQKFTFNPLAENTYIIYDHTRACIFVDPGCATKHEEAVLSAFILEHDLEVTKVVNTHWHIDHIVGNAYVKQTYGVPLAIHPQDAFLLALSPQYAQQYGMTYCEPTVAEQMLEAGDKIKVGASQLQVLHVPGHSPGHIALYSAEDKFCVVGDVLFRNHVGRIDLPGGDYHTLIKSIQEQLLTLEDETIVYSGHGAKTTIGAERQQNPFLRNITP